MQQEQLQEASVLEGGAPPQEMIGPEYDSGIERAFPEIVQQIEDAYALMDQEAKEELMARPAGRKWGGSEEKRQGW